MGYNLTHDQKLIRYVTSSRWVYNKGFRDIFVHPPLVLLFNAPVLEATSLALFPPFYKVPATMCFLQRFLARRQSQRSMSQSTQEAQPLQAAPSTSIFHGVGTVTINGGTFILIGKRICW